MKILVTRPAGSIGSELALKLLEQGDEVVGLDNHNNYYDPAIKEARVKRFIELSNCIHERLDLKESLHQAQATKSSKFSRSSGRILFH